MQPVRPRGLIASSATRVTARISALLGLGSGSTVGGRVGLALDPKLLSFLGEKRRVALISGTNGKTTTTRLLAHALSDLGEVASSSSGANMDAGMVTALARSRKADVAALEVDEAHLPRAIQALDPLVIVLLNLSRDQLDRISEVRHLAQRWRDGLASSNATIVASADDPLVVYAARDCASVIWVATGALWHHDAYHCPVCDSRIDYDDRDGEPSWACRCGFGRPEPDARVLEQRLVLADGREFDLHSGLPGRFNRANAAMAAIAATCFGVELSDALAKAGDVADVAGRFSTEHYQGIAVRLLLAKNPAGFTELLDLVAPDERPLVIAINAQIADGHDPSWLWDVPFELLAGRLVVASGERRLDLAVRLRHAGVEHVTEADQRQALLVCAANEIDYIGNYTAFQQLRRVLERKASAPKPDHPVSPPPEALLPAPRPPDFLRTGSSGGASTLRIVVVHPDLLGTYGDAGNATILANRARWRGLGVEVVFAPSDVEVPELGDLYVLGGGEDGPQARSADRLRGGTLSRAVGRGAVVLAVCAGFQIIGESFPGASGQTHAGLDLIDVRTIRHLGPRSVGEVLSERSTELFGQVLPILSGFENHQSATQLGNGVDPLAEVHLGVGNGEQGHEGAVYGRVIGTYLHGPVLARNPTLADVLLGLAAGAALEPMHDEEEEALRAERIERARSTGREHRYARLLTRK